MKIKQIFAIVGMLAMFVCISSCSDDGLNILKRDTDELTYPFMSSSRNLYVLTNDKWQIMPSEEWISCTPNSGVGAAKEQIVKVTVEQNNGAEREGYVTLTDGVKKINIAVKQADGFFYLGNLEMPEFLILNNSIGNKTINIPYYKSKPGYKANVTCTLLVNDKPTEEITVAPIVDKEMGLGDGVLALQLSGTPTERGELKAQITVDINGEKTEYTGVCRVKIETEVNASVYKLFPRMVVMEWGRYEKGSSANPMGQGNDSRDYDFELALSQYGAPIRRSVTSKANWFVTGMFFGENRFVYGNLKPQTEYWFRIVQKKAGASQNLTTDTTYVKFVTPSEAKLDANTVLYDDFDRFCIKGSHIYRAFGIAVTNAVVGADFDPNNDDSFIPVTGICTPTTTMDPLFDQRNNTAHALHWSKCPKVWNHYWETDKYGLDNISDLENYPGWANYFARESTGAILLGAATTAGAYLKTPFLTKLGDTPSNITVVTNTCAYYEPFHSWDEDCLYHYIQIEGPGKIVDAGSTKATGILPVSATEDSDKSVLVKMNANKEGAGLGPKYDWNQTTKHTIKITGATKDTRVVIKNVTPCSNAAHCRVAIDDILIIKN